MKRALIVGSIATTALLLLGACSAPAQEGGSPSSTDMKANISYAVWDQTQVPALKQNIADFNQKYPNVKVSVDVTPWAQYWTKLQTQASSGTLPDVFWMNGPNFQLYAANDQLAPVTSLVKSGEVDPSNYPEALDNLYTYEKVQYGVPKDFDTIAVWYNKAILDKAGVEVPKPDWTWEDFASDAQQVSDKLSSQGIYGVATALDGGQEGYYDTIYQAGGEVVSEDGTKSEYDSQETINGLQFWADLIKDGASPSLQQLSDTPPNTWFLSGKSAFFWSGSWQAVENSKSPMAGDFNVAPLPKGERQATVIHGLANVVSAKSKNLAAAQAFQTFLGTEQAQVTQAKTGVIAAFSGTQKFFVESVPNWDLQVFIDGAENYAFPYPVSRNTSAWNLVESKLLPAAFSGDKPVDSVAKDLASQMSALLAKE